MHPETLKAFPEGWFPAGVATRTVDARTSPPAPAPAAAGK